ncbi:MAG: YebC/PmpR family DNA-binding transcriptional regulator [Clostridia bacterium]|nr:YebC/PmpR family DNA-binding transcriptional regulator [Clostridia bacterium]
MSGHSKWNNIKHKKEKTDAQRGKIFTKIGKEMAIAIKAGGADPASNSKLRDLIAKAKANNVPNDNIDRVIKKALGETDVVYEEIYYEGYGPSGVAVIVYTTTDNRNRTASEMRHYFDKFGGNLGQTGCVSYLFADKGVIIVADDEDAKEKIDEDKLMEDALEAGAGDFVCETPGIYEIYTEPADLGAVREELEAKGYKIESAELDKIPSTYVELSDPDDIKHMNLLLEHLEDNDDVQDVYHNWENADEE